MEESGYSRHLAEHIDLARLSLYIEGSSTTLRLRRNG
jgi:hypothetical protein